MAKVTITISDDKKIAGKINVSAEFSPPIKRKKPVTPAQNTGAQVVQEILEIARGEADDEDENE
jgi:hypothetical protein